MQSIGTRLNILFVLIATIALGVSGTYSYFATKSDLEAQFEMQRRDLQGRLEISLPRAVWDLDEDGLARIIQAELAPGPIEAIVVTSKETRIFVGRGRDGNGNIVSLTQNAVLVGERYEFPLVYGNQRSRHSVGQAIIYMSRAGIRRALNEQVIRKLIEIILLDVILVVALSRSLYVVVLRPLHALKEALHKAAAQQDKEEKAVELAETRSDEFGDVVKGFNVIARKLLDDLRRRREAEEAMRQAKESAEKAYSQLKETQASLVQAEKMASLGGLVAGIAHEINTPIGITLTSATLLAAETDKLRLAMESGVVRKADVQEYVGTADESARLIVANAQRAAHLIQSFKQVAVDQTSEARRQFDLRQYVDEVITSLRPKLKHTNIKIAIDIPARLEIDGYPGALSQVLTNFVVNSLVHAYDDGDEGEILIRAIDDGDQVIMSYHDDGRGIPPDHLPKIFDPFFTTRRGAGGSGLGLNIVYNIISKRLGGRVSVDSKLGEGTTFTLSFPKTAPMPSHEE